MAPRNNGRERRIIELDVDTSSAESASKRYLNSLQEGLRKVGEEGGEGFAKAFASKLGGDAVGGVASALGKAVLGGLESASAGVTQGIASAPLVAPDSFAFSRATNNLGSDFLAGAAETLPIVGGPLGAMIRRGAAREDFFAETPLNRTQARVSGALGAAAAAGVDVSDRDIEFSVKQVQEQERRRLLLEKRVADVNYSSGSVSDAYSFAASALR